MLPSQGQIVEVLAEIAKGIETLGRSTPFRVVRRRQVAAPPAVSAAFPSESRYVAVKGSRMAYVEQGEGQPILLLHGNPTWSYLWRNVLPHLAPLGRAIAPDLIGMGRSGKPSIGYRLEDHAQYLEAFIAALGLGNLILVAHDWGSALAFLYAMRHPANVRGLAFFEALLKPYALWEEFPAASAPPQLREVFRRFRTGGEGGEGYELIVEQNVFIEQLLPAVAGRGLSQAEMDRYREPFATPESRRVIWRWVNEIPIAGEPADVVEATAAYSAWLERSPVPKLLLRARPGAILLEEHVDWARRSLPNLEVVDVGPGLHFLQESSPDEVGRALAEWVKRLPAPAAPAARSRKRRKEVVR
jgi:haloalkane dehalogenase